MRCEARRSIGGPWGSNIHCIQNGREKARQLATKDNLFCHGAPSFWYYKFRKRDSVTLASTSRFCYGLFIKDQGDPGSWKPRVLAERSIQIRLLGENSIHVCGRIASSRQAVETSDDRCARIQVVATAVSRGGFCQKRKMVPHRAHSIAKRCDRVWEGGAGLAHSRPKMPLYEVPLLLHPHTEQLTTYGSSVELDCYRAGNNRDCGSR